MAQIKEGQFHLNVASSVDLLWGQNSAQKRNSTQMLTLLGKL